MFAALRNKVDVQQKQGRNRSVVSCFILLWFGEQLITWHVTIAESLLQQQQIGSLSLCTRQRLFTSVYFDTKSLIPRIRIAVQKLICINKRLPTECRQSQRSPLLWAAGIVRPLSAQWDDGTATLLSCWMSTCCLISSFYKHKGG